MKYLLLITIIFSHLVFANSTTEKLDPTNKKISQQGLEAELVLLQKRADEGDREARYRLGILYLDKLDGVFEDYKKAMHWLKQAADQGHREAQYRFAKLHFDGFDILKNPMTAEKYYKLAADQGHEEAQYELGKMYFNGIGSIPINFEQAFKYYQLAAKQGHKKAQHMFAHIHHYGTKTISINLKLAKKYYELSAKQGYMLAQYMLGTLYDIGPLRSPELALYWYRQAADQGHRSAQMAVDNLNQEQKPQSWFMSKIAPWVKKQESKILQKDLEKEFIKEDLNLIVEEFITKCMNLFRKKA